ncbi:MAG: hypothetical protein AB1758_26775, partial [Candidatus Eremiobacterota bacterium]
MAGTLASVGQRAAEDASVPVLGVPAFLWGVARHFVHPAGFFHEMHDRLGQTFRVELPTRHRFLFESRPEAVHKALTTTDSNAPGCPW